MSIIIDPIKPTYLRMMYCSLGNQYIFRTDKAMRNLTAIENYYLCVPEREDCKASLIERGFEIDTKLKLAKREFKSGLYIEEMLK